MCLRIVFAALMLLTFTKASVASGYFELQVLSVRNVAGELYNGDCCDGDRLPDASCRQNSCDTQVDVCLKEYQARVTTDGPCTFGKARTEILGGNEFFLSPEDEAARLKLPFEFGWLMSFTLVLKIFDNDNTTFSAAEELIDIASHSGYINPGPIWQTLNFNGPVVEITYKIRVLCDDYLYGTNCLKFCRPRDDSLGHYLCDSNGDKVCMPGWTGSTCEQAICRQGCHAVHGSCEVPNECRCAHGWQGELCDRCQTYPSCVHGTCNLPWQCNCDLNWGGYLCEKDLNPCGTQPCLNDGTCTNTEPDRYHCQCREGYSGTNCEIAEHACASNPCYHSATCQESPSGEFICKCSPGWTGVRCSDNVDECLSNPCLNGGTCQDLVNGYECLCSPGWNGANCALDQNECQGRPCVHAFNCRNLVGDYICDCQPGWTGKNCDHNADDCHGQCQNGATCLDLVNDYQCVCEPGFTGTNCEVNIDDCVSNPCQNGGRCEDRVNRYNCNCPPGYSGHQCQVDVNFCDPNPCQNGASCFKIENDYYCACTDSYQGKNCSHPKPSCQSSSCETPGNPCTVSVASNSSAGGVKLIPSSVCGDHGMCLNHGGGVHSCVCNSGYTGRYCHENINDCENHLCQNQATCVDGLNSYTCICAEGWEGLYCHIDKNECEHNPCRNNGTCVDLPADFFCQCADGWKGKTCNSRTSHCDKNTCRNGGVCSDQGEFFSCDCPVGWHGRTCNLPTNNSCEYNPCQHGATCINSGDTYTCICKEGFEGINCQINIDDCKNNPCYNGGRCIDGVNWFVCECAPGFSGPDCRININDCSSYPCAYGSTCIDGINAYTCICPPRRTGPKCSTVIGVPTPSPFHCVYNDHMYSHNQTWEEGCNKCKCDNGVTTCSQVWCGPGNCAVDSKGDRLNSVKCRWDQSCKVAQVTEKECFTEPCGAVGVCEDFGQSTEAPTATSDCLPSVAELNNHCAMITLLFDREKMPLGVSVSYMCALFHNAPIQHVDNTVVIICDRAPDSNDSIVVAVSTPRSTTTNVKVIVDNIAAYISQANNSSVLAAVKEIKIETTRVDIESSVSILLICLVLGSAALIAIAACFFKYFCGRRKKRRREREEENAQSKELRKKCNINNSDNKNNEREHFRKLKNPIFEERRENSNANDSTVELEEIQHLNKNVPRTQKDIYKPETKEAKHNILKQQHKPYNEKSRTVTFELMV
ncbi:protein jagged-1-like isoform X1 [Ptychodera flava]|uniref:protein jagged-1-like isoform X1 n=1 Tax=Ptychodera flava TaxID=63121 RepID=UPI00396A7034